MGGKNHKDPKIANVTVFYENALNRPTLDQDFSKEEGCAPAPLAGARQIFQLPRANF